MLNNPQITQLNTGSSKRDEMTSCATSLGIHAGEG